jgi:hypothetical protein
VQYSSLYDSTGDYPILNTQVPRSSPDLQYPRVDEISGMYPHSKSELTGEFTNLNTQVSVRSYP